MVKFLFQLEANWVSVFPILQSFPIRNKLEIVRRHMSESNIDIAAEQLFASL